MENLSTLMQALGHAFADERLLRLALIHKSVQNAQDDNQRLEFLGDAVLQLVSSEALFARNPRAREGELTRMRASLVCEKSLADAARRLGLGQHLIMERSIAASGGRDQDAALADAMEAVLAAVYLDGGLDAARKVARLALKDYEPPKAAANWKGLLQEREQKAGRPQPQYQLLRQEGPPHARIFFSQVFLQGILCGEGSGHTKQAAEQNAAENAMKHSES